MTKGEKVKYIVYFGENGGYVGSLTIICNSLNKLSNTTIEVNGAIIEIDEDILEIKKLDGGIKLVKGDRISCWIGNHPSTIDGICKGTVIDVEVGENHIATQNYLGEMCTIKLDNNMVIKTESCNLTPISNKEGE
jgi:hypothetical protein